MKYTMNDISINANNYVCKRKVQLNMIAINKSNRLYLLYE